MSIITHIENNKSDDTFVLINVSRLTPKAASLLVDVAGQMAKQMNAHIKAYTPAEALELVIAGMKICDVADELHNIETTAIIIEESAGSC